MKGTEDFNDCLHQHILTSAELENSKLCFPIVFNFLTLLPCNTGPDFWCIEKFTLNERQNRYECLQLKNQKEFHVDAYQDGFTNGTKTGVEVVIYSSRNTKRVKEEMLVITTGDFIGSVGGSLGLFLGFSFFTYLLEILQKFV